MPELKNKVKELKKLNWGEIKKLNFNQLKNNSNRDVSKLKKSVLNRGFFSPFMVWNDFVFDGTGRLQALKELEKEGVEIPDLPCLFVEANNLAEAKIYALQMSSQHGEITQESLYEFVVDIPEVEALTDEVDFYEFNMEFGEVEVEELEPEAKEDDFEVPEQIKTDIVQGDIFEFRKGGKTLHRLMCGDSTQIGDIEKLMNGEKVDMVFTDPPYGISVVKAKMVGADFGVAKKGRYSEVIADDTTKTAQEFYQSCVSLGMDKFIIWGGNYFTNFLPFSDSWLIWNKRANTDIRNTFADGEMAWCSFHTPIRIYDQLWNGMVREGEKGKRVHPTQKPIRMLSEIIDDHIKGKLIFDGFLGSGSTMVASHQLNRRCYGMELDCRYTEVCVLRMLKLDKDLEIIKNGENKTQEYLNKLDNK